MSDSIQTDASTLSQPLPETWLLSEHNIKSHNLVFGLNFRPTKVPKSGLINRIKNKQQSMDIDISCLLFDANCTLVDQVWFKQLRDQSQAIRHHGDSLNGKDRGSLAEIDHNVDLEQIELRLSKLPEEVQYLTLIVSSYYGQPLTQLEYGAVRIEDDEGNIIDLQDLNALPANCNALWLACLSRELGEWRVTMHKFPLAHHDIPHIADDIKKELLRALAL
ncbi:TerD family protein [Psychrobacter sp. I-STPA6b]|uniref:TerD family protein n=1 Tax=Psychrobacter sp. I-STPA6b TaxID=2585718 RepID=UPI001D0CA620|nr:TerD family protein [Psychrobacter sp. I-STPA6b]